MAEGTDSNILIYVILAALAAAILAWLLYRNAKTRARRHHPILSERPGDERPYLRAAGGGVADEVAAATGDVYGEVLGADTHGGTQGGDDLQLLKGVGPKLAARFNELGIVRYDQLAGLGETEVTMLDDRLGPFRGRVRRDRLVEQAQFLARADKDGFEARFGKLGGEA
jgi:predicted flap endonuclease-1-like 5' DNA nuclease